ncbi:MAG: cytochrome c3 family protein [Terriglobia bacterium]
MRARRPVRKLVGLWWLWLLFLPGLLLLPSGTGTGQATKSDVLLSSHNLSATGPGPVTSSEQDACLFCHTPHSSIVDVTPLWNHELSTQTYNTYTSSTYDAGPATPSTGVSKLCLSCHDGTVALGQTVSEGLIPTIGSMSPQAVLGTDLTNDHPLGVQPVDDGQLVLSLFQSPPRSSDPAVQLPSGRIECTSCHDPHSQALDAVAQDFLVRSNSGGVVCLACHDPNRPQPNALNGWFSGAHSTAANTVPTSVSFGPYGSVTANACGNCHSLHGIGAASAARLLRAAEEATCNLCHAGVNASPPLPNVLGEFAKTFAHPTTMLSGLHDAAENAFPLSTNRHAECTDCHNPHGASSTGGAVSPPGVEAALLGASGFNGGTPLQPAANEFEVCYKCHADSTNKPQATPGYSAFGRTPRRQTDNLVPDPYNARLEFNSTVSRHDVASPRGGPGSNNTVPSLRPAIRLPNGTPGRSLAVGTYIYCTDCHNNEAARNFGGTGPNGPHASTNQHLLVQPHPMNPPPAVPGDQLGEVVFISGAVTYPLCNMCHYIDRAENPNAILNDGTFRHRIHIRGGSLSCDNCHDPHGIQGGNLVNNPSLINWDLAMVGPNTANQGPRLDRAGVYSGSCFLRCHNNNHNPRSY